MHSLAEDWGRGGGMLVNWVLLLRSLCSESVPVSPFVLHDFQEFPDIHQTCFITSAVLIYVNPYLDVNIT